jgi:peptidoglycan/LPS O-acetylase OafA/YrhL
VSVSTRTVAGVHWADLDGLRAIAILLVLARHSLRPFISEDTYQPVAAVGPVDLTPFLLNGWTGVDLFFVLSGFLIGRQAWRRDGLARFWFRRVTRIVPAYWTCLLVVAVGITLSGAWPRAGTGFAAHLLMLQDYTGASFVPAFWSLGAEEKFYLAAPLIVSAVAFLPAVRLQGAALALLWALPVGLRAWAAADVTVVSYETYFPAFRRSAARSISPVSRWSSASRSRGCRCTSGCTRSAHGYAKASSGAARHSSSPA